MAETDGSFLDPDRLDEIDRNSERERVARGDGSYLNPERLDEIRAQGTAPAVVPSAPTTPDAPAGTPPGTPPGTPAVAPTPAIVLTATGRKISDVFVKFLNSPDADRRTVAAFVERLGEEVEDAPEAVRSYADQLGSEVDQGLLDAHRKWIESREDLTPELKAKLVDEKARLEIRIKTFNEMCRGGVFSLTGARRYRGPVDNREEFNAYLMSALTPEERMHFERACDSFDGEGRLNLIREGARGLVGAEAARGATDVTELARQRKSLFSSVATRMSRLGVGDSPEVREAGKLSRFLDSGGDVALSGAALLALLSSSPMLAATFYGAKVAKNTLEAITGVESADLIEMLKNKLVEKGKDSGRLSLKKLWASLPETIRGRDGLKKFDRWVTTDRPFVEAPLRFPVDRFSSVGWMPRVKHFLTGLIPFVPGGKIPFEKSVAGKFRDRGMEKMAIMVESERMGRSAPPSRIDDDIRNLYSRAAA
ncbi:MAG: hypothetical protein AAB592_02230 [Patescibacteria group bacterium]